MKATALRFALAAAGTALGALLLSGAAAAQDTIKIGVTQPLTGAFAASGNDVAQGAKLAEEAINGAGGVLGKKIELIVEDNKSNPTEAAATAEKLIVKDKVPVMLGAWGSGLTLAIMPKLEDTRCPWWSRRPRPARSPPQAIPTSSASAQPPRWRRRRSRRSSSRWASRRRTSSRPTTISAWARPRSSRKPRRPRACRSVSGRRWTRRPPISRHSSPRSRRRAATRRL